jgi:predicted RNA-binding Zn ribbon-like protein
VPLNLIPDDPSAAERATDDGVPRPAALVRDFVNTLDHELGTDELATTEGLTAFCAHHGLLEEGVQAVARDLVEAVRLRRGLHNALELNHAGEQAPLATLDEALAALPVRLRWVGDGVVAAPADDGVAGALARIGLAAHEARASELWWRLKICAFDECEWAYYDQSKNRSRHYCEYGCGNKLKTRAYRARRRAERTDR